MIINPKFAVYKGKPVIRCSGLDRLLFCSGSRELENRLRAALAEIVDLSDGVEGDEMTWRGNWCHWKSASILVRDHGAVAVDGLEPPSLPAGWAPDKWDERSAEWFVNNAIAETPEDHAIFVEHRLTIEFPRFWLTGQIDSYSTNPDGTEFIICDQKSGPNEVDHAEENWQLMGYAVLLKRHLANAKRGTLKILQRAATIPITSAEVEDLDLLAPYLEEKINAALDAALALETGYKACRLCPCIEFCPALELEIIRLKLLLTKEQLDALKVTPDLRQLAEVAAQGRAVAGPITRLLAALKARVAAEGPVVLKDGTSVSIEEGLGDRSITNVKVAFAFVSEKLIPPGMPDEVGEDAAWDTLRMSLGDVEDKLVNTGMQRTSKKPDVPNAERWIKDNLGHLITRPKQSTLKFK
jgi:hypothetical protein